MCIRDRGDTVYVHAGSYTLNAGPILDNMSLTIIGDGASSTVINFVGAGTRMYFYMYPGPGRTCLLYTSRCV